MKTARNLAIVSVLISGFVAGCKKKEVVLHRPTPPTPPTPATPAKVTDPLKPAKPTMKDRGRPASEAPTDQPTVVTVVEADQPAREVENSADTAGRDTYTIRKDDTLWSIAVRYLGDGQRWRDIVKVNPGLDPKKVKAGQVIKLPPK